MVIGINLRKRERTSRRGGGGGRVEWGPLWAPAVLFLPVTQHSGEPHPRAATKAPTPHPHLSRPHARPVLFLRLMRITADQPTVWMEQSQLLRVPNTTV